MQRDRGQLPDADAQHADPRPAEQGGQRLLRPRHREDLRTAEGDAGTNDALCITIYESAGFAAIWRIEILACSN